MNPNYKEIIKIFLLGFALSVLLWACVPEASAIGPIETGPTLIPVYINATSAFGTTGNENRTYEVHRISQGDYVYLGDHIDISGVVPGNRALAWFASGGPDYAESPYVIELPTQKAAYYDFYIDPAIFAARTGGWHKWNGYYEKAGNTLAFQVRAMYRNTTMTFPNGTVINQSQIVSGEYAPVPIPTPEIIPTEHVSDYLVPHGQDYNITFKEETKIWIFGRVDQLLDYKSINRSVTIPEKTLTGFEGGSYTLVTQTKKSGNSDFTVRYNEETDSIQWFDPKEFIIHNFTLRGLSPQVTLSKFRGIIPGTQDNFKEYKLEVQEPEIKIRRMDFVSTGSAKEYYKNSNLRGNVTLYDIRGYTNVLPGTNLRFALDEENQPKNTHWHNTTAVGNSLGDMRTFEVYIPIYWDDLKAGVMHTISGYTDVGGSIYSDFPVRSSPEHSFIPNESVKWIDNRNPWIPTPTPEIIIQTKEVPVPAITIVTVTITPNPDELKQAADKANNDSIAFWAPRTLAGIVVIFLALYALSLFLRRREMGD